MLLEGPARRRRADSPWCFRSLKAMGIDPIHFNIVVQNRGRRHRSVPAARWGRSGLLIGAALRQAERSETALPNLCAVHGWRCLARATADYLHSGKISLTLPRLAGF